MTGPGLSSSAADFLAPLRNTTLLARLITLELLHTEVARPGCKINSAAAEKRRLVDLFQAGLIDMSELPRSSREVTSRHNELAAKRTAVAAERRTGAGQLTRPVSHRLRRPDPRRHQSTRPQTSPTKTQRPATGV